MVKPFQELTIIDDFMFADIMRQPEFIKPFLESILEKKIAEVVIIDKQKDFKDAYDAHGIRLDVYLEDEDRTKYDVEVQARLHPELERRVRFYQSGIDRHSLKTGEEYWQLPDSYIIFLCAKDYYKAGLAVYERESHIKCAPEIRYEDGSHVYILNADFSVDNANAEITDFLRYVRAGVKGESFDVSKSNYLQKLDDEIKRIKGDSEREMEYMTYAMRLQDERRIGREEGRKMGQEEGRMERDKELVQRLLAKGRSLDEICDIVGLDMPEVRKLVGSES